MAMAGRSLHTPPLEVRRTLIKFRLCRPPLFCMKEMTERNWGDNSRRSREYPSTAWLSSYSTVIVPSRLFYPVLRKSFECRVAGLKSFIQVHWRLPKRAGRSDLVLLVPPHVGWYEAPTERLNPVNHYEVDQKRTVAISVLLFMTWEFCDSRFLLAFRRFLTCHLMTAVGLALNGIFWPKRAELLSDILRTGPLIRAGPPMAALTCEIKMANDRLVEGEGAAVVLSAMTGPYVFD